MMPWLAEITYGAGTTLRLSLPLAPWDEGTASHGGGREESAAQVPSVWPGRRYHTADLRIRFRESEWPAVRAWLTWAADTGQAFGFRPDRSDARSFPVHLVAPDVTERILPQRTEEPSTLEISVTLRTTNGTPFDLAYFGDE